MTDRPRTIGDVLQEARARLVRLTAQEAYEAVRGPAGADRPAGAAGPVGPGGTAILVDIRPQAQRAREGEVPGALVVERNVLEWRFDPASGASLPFASHDLQVVVLCSEGYTSSLAAASLQDLGVRRATDVEGGFVAWRRAGLPTTGGERDGAGARG